MSFSIIHNNCILESSNLSPAEFLRRHPPGPYTSLIARGEGRVIAWGAHISRLATGLRELDSCISPISAASWRLQRSIDETSEEVQKQLLPKLRVAFSDDKRQKSGLPDLSIVALLGTENGYGSKLEAAFLGFCIATRVYATTSVQGRSSPPAHDSLYLANCFA